jgi:5-methylcytosine-specific restriction endonuclease McrA
MPTPKNCSRSAKTKRNGKMTASQIRSEKNQGMNWCRPSTRLAIYLRDGLACCWCGSSVEEGTQLSLDHIKPVSKGGDNQPTNLITCCMKCNSSRGNRSAFSFAKAVAQYIEKSEDDVLKHVLNCKRRVLPREEARELLSRRGTISSVLARVAPEKPAS